MRILAIESAELAGSVAALSNDQLLAQSELDASKRSAQTMAAGIVDLLHGVGWQPREVELIAVATGPGSFTGLRVGVTTAKMYAYAVGARVMGVSTLEAIAEQAPAGIRDLWAIIDAQREQVFAAQFSRADGGLWNWIGETLLLDDAAWLSQLSPGVAVSGPGLAKLSPRVPHEVAQLDRLLWSPKAAAVGKLAWQQYQSGRRDDLGALVPHYFRPSAAEEKRARMRK